MSSPLDDLTPHKVLEKYRWCRHEKSDANISIAHLTMGRFTYISTDRVDDTQGLRVRDQKTKLEVFIPRTQLRTWFLEQCFENSTALGMKVSALFQQELGDD